MSQKIFISILAIIGISIFVVITGYFTINKQSLKVISTFEECATAGYPIMESYLRQCRTSDGQLFVENITPTDQPQQPISSGGCAVGGCSGQLCVEANKAPGAITTCEYRAEYSCYQKARCERQANNQCGWTQTQELQVCLKNPQVACTMEAKLCPDGSAVGRTGPNCEFAKCLAINPLPVAKCKKDSDCSSPQYICQETQGSGTACSSTDPSCVPTHTVIAGECKLKEGNRCNINSDCAAGNLCNKNICTSPIGRQCAGPNDTSCPADFECIQGCGPPVVRYPDDTTPSYFCQLKGYIRNCPICLSKNTLIDTPLGAIAVQDIQKSAPVWTVNNFGKRVLGYVIKISKTPVPPDHKMVKLVLEDRRKLLVSPGHPTADGRTAGNLIANDFYDGARVVTSERVAYGDAATYDILPSGETGFYWANGILLDSTLH